MNHIDKRGRLQEEVFTYQETKDGKVFIFWQGKRVTILSGKKAQQFMAKIAAADHLQAQLFMAKATGNFKRGNERA
ncbi:MAG: hypothetical protein KA314_26540 [Chloroflexi bacterium]|nr:hypothetical protein [Chloroflexota bacterium]MBP8059409.1 hypothetical protein [Chloroflexota bacterium]